MSIFAFVATRKVTAFVVASNLAEGTQFWWRKTRCWLGSEPNEISFDVSHSHGRHLRIQRLRVVSLDHCRWRSSFRRKYWRGKRSLAVRWRRSERQREVVCLPID